MEIKIIEKSKGQKTSIFEGADIRHEHIVYNSGEDFIQKYNELGFSANELSGHVLGVPEEIWKKGNKIGSGYFLLIYYRIDELKFIVVKNATVFITNKGQTIDRIIIE